MHTQLNNNKNDIINGGNYNSTAGGNNLGTPFCRLFYFCTHGACNNKGVHCCSKAEGHKDTTIFDNHLNGSDFHCHYHER